MTDSEMRICIAEACGWIDVAEHGDNVIGLPPGFTEDQCPEGADEFVPNYLNNWNPMHEAVNALNQASRLVFLEYLDRVTRLRSKDWFPYRIVTSTLREWAQAYLQTVNKWSGN